MKKLIFEIKKKKTLQAIDDELVQESIETVLKQNPKLNKKCREQTLKEKDKKQIVKETRNILNRIYGAFWKENKILLQSHQSTKEREPYYTQIYNKIFNKFADVKTILDLAAGLNPLSYPMIPNYAKKEFIATEFAKRDVEKLNMYFQEKNINGKAIQLNLFKKINVPKADMVFIWKILDLIETKGHKKAEEIIDNLNAKYVVISFSTKTLKNKRMNYLKRGWLEQLLKRKQCHFEKFAIPNEEFYLISKEHS